jgi:hypothetical protein
VLKADAFPAGVTAQFFDGNTDITSQVTGAGFPINNFASGGMMLLKVKGIVSRSATKNVTARVSFRLARAANANVLDYGGVQIFVK